MGLRKEVENSFDEVGSDIDCLIDSDNLLRKAYIELFDRFNALEKELAHNGVVSDLRKLQKDFNELQKHTANLIMEHDIQLAEIACNGVSSSINKLNKEVFEKYKEIDFSWYDTVQKEATLAGKVDAIIEYLGIDVKVKPEESAKVEAKKVVKKITKKGKK